MEEKRPQEKKGPEEDQERPQSLMHHAFGGFYEKFRGVPLKYLDIFIWLCIAAIAVVLIVGVLQGRGML